ncbi:hypothetical protein NKG05_19160 [Oerskovia sp. M15]
MTDTVLTRPGMVVGRETYERVACFVEGFGMARGDDLLGDFRTWLGRPPPTGAAHWYGARSSSRKPSPDGTRLRSRIPRRTPSRSRTSGAARRVPRGHQWIRGAHHRDSLTPNPGMPSPRRRRSGNRSHRTAAPRGWEDQQHDEHRSRRRRDPRILPSSTDALWVERTGTRTYTGFSARGASVSIGPASEGAVFTRASSSRSRWPHAQV